MRVWCNLLSCLVPLFALAYPASAQELVEMWRSPWGVVTDVSVDPDDGSCWAAVGDKVIHLTADGSLLSATPGFFWPSAVSVNRADNSCWVSQYGQVWNWWTPEYGGDRVAHLAPDGAVLWSGTGFTSPLGICANPTDGSCHVADTYNDEVVHLSADGHELWRGGGFARPSSVSVNEADGSCWVADRENGQLVHLAADGSELWSDLSILGSPGEVSVNQADGSCWVAWDAGFQHVAADGTLIKLLDSWPPPTGLSANSSDGSWWTSLFSYWWSDGEGTVAEVRHYAADGTELWRGNGFDRPESVSVNSDDSSCWVADSRANQLIHLDEQGDELLRVGEPSSPGCVSVNRTDGSAWVVEWRTLGAYPGPGLSELVHYRADGEELWRGGNLETPLSVSVNPSDGSCWVVDLGVWDSESENYIGGGPVHLAADGTELHRVTEVANPYFLSVDSSDGSCWVSSLGPSEVVHLAPDGTVLWRGGNLGMSGHIAASPSDGSCWIIDCDGFHPVHIAADGTEVWRSDGQVAACQLTVNPEDGSCWTTDTWSVRHFSPGGEELSDTPVACCSWALAVDPGDGSCWVAANVSFDLVRLSPEGFELSRHKRVLWAESLSVNRADGSLWVADTGAGQLAHLAWYDARFPDIPFGFWARREIEACAGGNIISGYDDGLYHPDWPVTRDQMAVYISRALAGGDGNVPAGPDIASFLDIPRLHWAYKYVEYAKSQGIVTGYGGRIYAPGLPVTRDHMAVFIARARGWLELGQPMDTAPELYPDVPAGFWSGAAIQQCLDNAVLGGYDDGLYHPDWVVTRDQMAAFISRAFELVP